MTTGSPLEEPPLTIRRRPSFWVTFWTSRFGWSFAPAVCVAVAGMLWLGSTGNVLVPFESTVTLKGVMASKRDFFEDAEVQRLLLKHHIRVEVTARGSYELAREIINQETDQYDFAFPSGQPPADLIKRHRAARGKYNKSTLLFTSPVVLASFREYTETLVRKGVAAPHDPAQDKSLYYTLDTAKFMELGASGQTWNSIGIDKTGTGITNGNRVLAQVPGVCRANSAATYLGLIAFVDNGEEAPQTEGDVDRIAERVRPLIRGTGMPESDLFRAYVTPEGKGEGPVIVVYEHQYFGYQLEFHRRNGMPDIERVLLYPRQEFQTDPEFISLNADGGDRLADLLVTDSALRNRMLELGYRLEDPTGETGTRQLFAYLTKHGISAPVPRTDYTRAHLPELELLERLIRATAGGCPP